MRHEALEGDVDRRGSAYRSSDVEASSRDAALVDVGEEERERLLAPGSSRRSSWCDPTGLQPWATLPVARPPNGTAASCNPLCTPTNASREVSNPATRRVHANSVVWPRRSRYSVVWKSAAPSRSTATSPIESVRWRFVASFSASYGQNST